jgi:hypothetical protein
LQAAYEQFGCNDGNVFFIGIDKGNTNDDVISFDSTFGIQYPGFSGQDGGGNEVHLLYQIQATPCVIVIQPDREISVKQIWLPTTANIVDSVSNAGGILQSCLTNIQAIQSEEILTIGPNPVKDFAYFHLNFKEAKEISMNVFNLTGTKILEFEPAYYPAGKYNIKADFTSEPEGFYFVQIIEKGELIATKKIILIK